MEIRPADIEQFEEAKNLLLSQGLPVSDLDAGKQLFVALENGEVVGTVAVEYDWDNALLRSLATRPENRSSGIGSKLISFIEHYVKTQGVKSVFILTTTAEGYFLKKGYHSLDREEAPSFIKQTNEFGNLCPASAAFMKKDL